MDVLPINHWRSPASDYRRQAVGSAQSGKGKAEHVRLHDQKERAA